MIISEWVEAKWSSSNKKWYESKGHVFTKFGDLFLVKVENLTKTSSAIVEIECDNPSCNNRWNLPFNMNKYNKQRSINKEDYCPDCRNIKVKHRFDPYRISLFPVIQKSFEERNCILITTLDEFKGSKAKLKYKCKYHLDKGILKITWNDFSNGHGCKYCGIERKSGESHHNWDGGISSINEYLRDGIAPWKKESMTNCNYKCVITGERFDDIHHLYPFHKIVEQSFKETNIPIRSKINEYNKHELELLMDKCLEIHYRYPLGVCLTEELHKDFHKLYGIENFTPEDFEEFKVNYFKNKITKVS